MDVATLQIPLTSLSFDEAMMNARTCIIQLALKKTGGNRSRAARILGVHRNTLARHMQALGLDKVFPDSRGKRPPKPA
jgi:DNA-binding NtrC family response regulator